MANLGATFDATGVEPNKPFEVVPPGKYTVQIVHSEVRPTKDGRGQYLWLELDVLEGALKGRKVFDRLNLVNPNPQTVEIAQRTLSAICHAVGKMQVQDSEELHLVAMLADVRVKPPKGEYGESNVIRYLPLNRQPPAAAPRPQPVAPAPRSATPVAAMAPAATTGNAPWKRSA